jgi:hypothetical protein
MPDTRKIIDFAAEDNAVAFRDALYSAIHDRVTAHIEAKKQEVAQNLITRNEEVELDEKRGASVRSDKEKEATDAAQQTLDFMKSGGRIQVSPKSTRKPRKIMKHTDLGRTYKPGMGEEVEELDYDQGLTEGHHMHTHTVHMADPVSGEWKGKMLMNADNDNHAVRQAKNMANKHGLKVMKVSKNHVIHSDRTMHEEVIFEGRMDDIEDARREKEEKKASNYEFDKKKPKTLKTIRKIAGHSDSGKKHKDDDEDKED